MTSHENHLREIAERVSEEMRKYRSPQTENERSISLCLHAICVIVSIMQAEKTVRKRKTRGYS